MGSIFWTDERWRVEAMASEAVAIAEDYPWAAAGATCWIKSIWIGACFGEYSIVVTELNPDAGQLPGVPTPFHVQRGIYAKHGLWIRERGSEWGPEDDYDTVYTRVWPK